MTEGENAYSLRGGVIRGGIIMVVVVKKRGGVGWRLEG
jgi:hypothetical protein